MTWNSSKIPSQRGRVAVVTGTGGLGLETAVALAAADAEVIVAGRNPHKGAEALRAIARRAPHGRARFEMVDLASLDSVRAFTRRIGDQLGALQLLVNNAAVMAPPLRQTSRDGYELQFATNYLSHFALTAGLLPLLQRADDARVVTVSSIAARQGVIDFSDVQSERRYQPMRAYGQSKLACLLFGRELQRRSDAEGWGISSIPVHPGISRTELIPNGAGTNSVNGVLRRALWFLFQPAEHGAWPSLFAATAAEACGGAYYGPTGFGETRGTPGLASVPAAATDGETATRLWSLSEELVGAPFASVAHVAASLASVGA